MELDEGAVGSRQQQWRAELEIEKGLCRGEYGLRTRRIGRTEAPLQTGQNARRGLFTGHGSTGIKKRDEAHGNVGWWGKSQIKGKEEDLRDGKSESQNGCPSL